MSWTHPESAERKLCKSDALAIQLPSSSQATQAGFGVASSGRKGPGKDDTDHKYGHSMKYMLIHCLIHKDES